MNEIPDLNSHITGILSKYFEEKLNNVISDTKFNFNVQMGYSRCLARVWDINNPNGPDINKRCRFVALDGLNVCKTHIIHNKHGFVNEYPPDHVIRCYLNKNKDILKQLNINQQLYIIENNTNKYLKKNVTYKSDKHMEDFSNINFEEEILNYRSKFCNLDSNANMHVEKIFKQIKVNHNLINVTRSEKETIISLITKYSKILGNIKEQKEQPKKRKLTIVKKVKPEKIIDSSVISTEPKSKSVSFNPYDLECVKIIDNVCMDCEVFLDLSNNNLYSRNGRVVGKCNEWIDDEDEIPPSYKNADNKVLHPKTRLPLLEYEVYKSGALFVNIKQGVYREYEYYDELEVFRKTNNVVRDD